MEAIKKIYDKLEKKTTHKKYIKAVEQLLVNTVTDRRYVANNSKNRLSKAQKQKRSTT